MKKQILFCQFKKNILIKYISNSLENDDLALTTVKHKNWQVLMTELCQKKKKKQLQHQLNWMIPSAGFISSMANKN
jgi:hypothetical protein